MTQLSIIITLLAALAAGSPSRTPISPAQQSHSGDTTSVDQTSKAEPPQEKTGVGEGGWPAF